MVTLGADSVSLKGSRCFAGYGSDRSNIALVEHVSLYVGSWAQAEAFYCEFLGFAEDPQACAVGPSGIPDMLRVSMGLNQLLLPIVGRRGISSTQALRGTFEVVYPPKEFARLEALVAEAAGEPGELTVRHVSSERLEVSCPWGNIWRCVPSGDAAALASWLTHLGVAPSGGASARGVGLSRIEIRCPVGRGSAIARFYRDLLGAPAVCSPVGRVDVLCGGLTALCFVESPDYVDMRGFSRGLERDQWSLALYLEDFEGAYDRLAEEGLEWDKARSFESGGSGGSGGSASSVNSATLNSTCDQFFFKDIRDLETGEIIMELEHEVRSLQHPRCPLGRFQSAQLAPSGILEAIARAEAESAQMGERLLHSPPDATPPDPASARVQGVGLGDDAEAEQRCGERRRASSEPPMRSETCARVCSLLKQPVAMITYALGRQPGPPGAIERGRSRTGSSNGSSLGTHAR